MRNIETFPSKRMYPYLSLVERKVAEFFNNINRRRWLVWSKWLIFITFPGQLMVSLSLYCKSLSVADRQQCCTGWSMVEFLTRVKRESRRKESLPVKGLLDIYFRSATCIIFICCGHQYLWFHGRMQLPLCDLKRKHECSQFNFSFFRASSKCEDWVWGIQVNSVEVKFVKVNFFPFQATTVVCPPTPHLTWWLYT